MPSDSPDAAALAPSTLCVDLGQAARLAGLPPSLHFQRRASQWREALRLRGNAEGILPIHSWAGDIFPLDALRQDLNRFNGIALQYLAMARTLARQHPGLNLDLADGPGSWSLVDALKWLGPERRKLHVHGITAWRRWAAIAKFRAHTFKVRLLRRYHQSIPIVAQHDNVDILAVPRMPGHLADLLPLAEALRREAGLETAFALVDPQLVDRVVKAGFDVRPLLPSDASARALLRRELPTARRQLRSLLDRPDTRPDDFDPTEHACLVKQTRQVLDVWLDKTLLAAMGTRRLMDQYSPRVVLVGNPYTHVGRVAMQVARGRSVPTTAVEHGTIFPNDPAWHDCPIDKMFVWGEPSRRALLTNGLSDRQIAVTGAPRHDVVFKQFVKGPWNPEATPTILVASSGPGGMVSHPRFQAFIQLLYEAADLAPEIEWVVKLHKKDRAEFYAAVRPEGHPRVRIERGDRERYGLDIYDYLQAARALVTISSSSALDAMVVDVPVISVDVWPEGQRPAGIEFLERCCTTGVRTAVELAAAARKAWNGDHDPAVLQAAQDYANDHFANRGAAAHAIVRQLQDLIKSAGQLCPLGGALMVQFREFIG